eukprot:TRINITY_DN17365_c0_g1_i1.p1 TRINITY_DN17365_c0_g1~~TRINITY_DN17365_c0_g1_i1.p1  ORF type:complete len:308 (+),score=44.31 TRINITY_DN17365_c0_g1_i1:31-924(+)
MGNVLIALGLQITRIKDDREDSWQALWRSSVSEFVGTAMFVFLGTGSVIASQSVLGEASIAIPSLTVIALAHGFAIMVIIYSIGEISGGHLNPAVTWACLITDRISFLRAIIYFIAQMGGAVTGSAILYGLIPPSLRFGLGCHTVSDQLTDWQGFGCEVVFTFIFLLVVFATAVSPFVGKIAPLAGGEYGPGKLTPFAVGMCILILHTVGIPLTGASMNPARSWGPAVVHGGDCWKDHWVYWWGPIIGSTVAAVTAQAVFLSSPAAMAQLLTYTRGVSGQTVEKIVERHQTSMDERS